MGEGLARWMTVALVTLWVFPACFSVEDPDDRVGGGDGGSGDTDADSDTDTDGDTDSDGDTDADGDPDPHYAWHTFYGSLSSDYGTSIAIDGDGNLFVAGWSWEGWNGPGGESPLHGMPSGETGTDLFVLKLDSNGAYQWHTFYGSYGHEYGSSIAVDGDGNVYVAGFTESGWLGDGGETPAHAHSGWGGAFALKLDADGAYQWHTFYGSSSLGSPGYFFSDGYALAVGGDGIYVTGYSLDTWTGPEGEGPLHPYTGDPADSVDYESVELFVLKLGSDGAYRWHTFYGSPGYDHGYSAAVDGDGDVYVAGFSDDGWVGPGEESPLRESAGVDLIVLKLNSDGAYQWHTFYGSSGGDQAMSVAADGVGGVYIAGASENAWTGPGGEDPLHAHSGGAPNYMDLAVLKLDSSGAYQWHTFYGDEGEADAYGMSVAVDEDGDVFVAGDSYASWDGPGGAAPLHENNGFDFFVLGLDASGAYRWHTFYGASGSLDGYVVLGLDSGRSVAVDGGSVYVTGFSVDPWSGPLGEGPLHADSGDYGDGFDYEDVFILKLAD